MKSKQTAVEWFFMTMNIRGLLPNDEIFECYNQAKAMEKQQIMRSHSSGYNSGLENKLVLSYEYYIKTFKPE